MNDYLLESIDDKERKQETWESLREDCAVGLAYEYFGAHSLTEMFKVMNALPNELKLQAKIKLIRLIIDEGEYESADLNSLLTDAEKENERFLFDNEDSKGYGIILVPPYAKIAEKSKEFPAQSFSVLRQTFQRWNKVYFSTKEKNLSDLKTSESFNVDQKLSPLNIPNYLLEKDFLTASNIIQEINSPIDRVRARLYALKFLLDKQQKLQKQIEDGRLNKKDSKVRQ